MGRKTWESLDKKPLPKRANIVITKNLPEHKLSGNEVGFENNTIFVNLSLAVKTFLTEELDFEICIIGGAQFYQHCLDNKLVDQIILSKIDLCEGWTLPKCDTFFPPIPKDFILAYTHRINDYYSREYWIK